MFNKDYPYKSSESLTMRNQFKKLSFKLNKDLNQTFIEIAMMVFLKNFDKKVIGVEPCQNLANITIKKGYKTFLITGMYH